MEGGESWATTCKQLRKEVRAWSEGTKDSNYELRKIEKEIDFLVKQPQTESVRSRFLFLQSEFQKYISAKEAYWLQRSCLNWNLMGDQTTKIFHSTTMVRRRRNRISAIYKENGGWAANDKEIRNEFITHFRKIYTEEPYPQTQPQFPFQVLDSIAKIPESAKCSWIASQ